MLRSSRALLAVLAASAVLLTGCTAQSDGGATVSATASASATPSASAAPTTTTTPSAMPTPSPSTSGSAAESRYVSAVQQLDSTLATVDPAILIALGHDVCRSFAAGDSAKQVAESFATLGETSGLSGAEAAVIIGAAVPTLCPQYRSKLSG